MNRQSLYSSLENLMIEFQNLINKQKENTNDVSRIDIDLLKDKTRKIYDLLINFESFEEEITEPIEEEKLVDIPTNEEYTIVKADENIESPQKEKETIDTTKTTIDPPLGEIEKIPIAPETTSFNLFSDSDETDQTKTIGEKLTEEEKVKTVADKIQSDTIPGLKLAIGINEKFFFINELFEGNMKEYNTAIEFLDQAEVLPEAIEQLNSMADTIGWDKKGEAFLQLKEFVERKFN